MLTESAGLSEFGASRVAVLVLAAAAASSGFLILRPLADGLTHRMFRVDS